MIGMVRRVLTLVAMMVAVMALAGSAAAQQSSPGPRTPLLMEGKKTLFQRVLTRPETKPHDKPDGTAGNVLPPMSALYWLHFVYLAALVAALAGLFWLARAHDRG